MNSENAKLDDDALDLPMIVFLAFLWGFALTHHKLPIWVGALLSTAALLVSGRLIWVAPSIGAYIFLFIWTAINVGIFWMITGISNSVDGFPPMGP